MAAYLYCNKWARLKLKLDEAKLEGYLEGLEEDRNENIEKYASYLVSKDKTLSMEKAREISGEIFVIDYEEAKKQCKGVSIEDAKRYAREIYGDEGETLKML